VNRPDGRYDYTQSFEVAVNKRLGNNWSLNSSYTANKNHTYVVSIPTSPNDDYFPVDATWNWAYKLSGNWNLPRDFILGAIMEAFSGPKGTRTYVFRAPGEAGGPALMQQTTVTLRLEPTGSQHEPAYAQINMRLGKKFPLVNNSLLLSFDALNVMNTNAVKAATYVSGPQFARVTNAVGSRQLRVGAQFTF
jgi:hypothetical protein